MKKGFTLLELLIVIGILAILSAVTILVINPAELLRKSRDTQRISDLGSINSAIAFYLTNTSSPTLGNATLTYSHTSTVTCMARTSTITTSQKVDSTGWVPVPLSYLTDGSPISSYPVDPNPLLTGNTLRYYVYLTNGSSNWELIANLESTYYTVTDNRELSDGGVMSTLYETGNVENILTTTTAACFGTSP